MKKIGYICAILAFGIFSIFAFLNYRSGLGFFDASEYALHIRGGGIAHAPGYPLYILLGRFLEVFTNDPFKAQFWLGYLSVAWLSFAFFRAFRGTALSFESITLGLLIFYSGYLNKLFVLFPEVFMLNLALWASLIWAIKNWYYSPDSRKIFFVLLVFGLGLCHHHTLALGLPGFLFLLWLKRGSTNWEASATFGLLGLCLGTLPLIYLFWPLSESTWNSYGLVNNLPSFLDVILRRGYGTLSLTTNMNGAEFFPFVKFIVIAVERHFNHLLALWLFFLLCFLAKRPIKVELSPVIMFVAISLFVFIVFFVPNSTMFLDRQVYRSVYLRFLTLPCFLLLYLLVPGFDWVLKSVSEKLRPKFLILTYGLVAVSNFFGDADLRFSHYNLLDRHIEEGYRNIFSVNHPTIDNLNADKNYHKCAIYARADSLVFGLSYYNRFVAAQRCYIFTPVSYSASFISLPEKFLINDLVKEDGPVLFSKFRTQPEKISQELFRRLRQRGFTTYLFYEPDYASFENTEVAYRPLGNILELVEMGSKKVDIRKRHIDYLNWLKNYLASLNAPQPKSIPDEVPAMALLQNLGVYLKTDSKAVSAELLELQKTVNTLLDEKIPF